MRKFLYLIEIFLYKLSIKIYGKSMTYYGSNHIKFKDKIARLIYTIVMYLQDKRTHKWKKH